MQGYTLFNKYLHRLTTVHTYNVKAGCGMQVADVGGKAVLGSSERAEPYAISSEHLTVEVLIGPERIDARGSDHLQDTLGLKEFLAVPCQT